MGHYITADILVEAGADPRLPDGLFRDVWDPEQLRDCVKNWENYAELRATLPSFLTAAAIPFFKMGQISDAEKMHQRAMEENNRYFGIEHSSRSIRIIKLALMLEDRGRYETAEEVRELRRRLESIPTD